MHKFCGDTNHISFALVVLLVLGVKNGDLVVKEQTSVIIHVGQAASVMNGREHELVVCKVFCTQKYPHAYTC